MTGGLRVFHGTADNSYSGFENSMDVTTAFPEFGLNYQVDDDLTFGLSVFGGGLMTDYDKPIVPLSGLDDSSNQIAQVNFAPTMTKKIGSSLYLGVSPTLLVTYIKTDGVPGYDNDSDTAIGFGFRVGLLWDATDKLSLGAMYTPRTKAGEWKKIYKDGILASSKGRLDSPEQLGGGCII